MENYKSSNTKIAEKAISKFLNHLYYLNEECVGLALFDNRINAATKTELIQKMREEIEEEMPKKLIIKQLNFTNFIERDISVILEELVTSKTKHLFRRFRLCLDFLEKEPETWNHEESYKTGKQIIENLKIVNDSAERGIKLVQDCNESITKDGEQKQYLFKVITMNVLLSLLLFNVT